MPFNHTITDGEWSVDLDTTKPIVALGIEKGYDSWIEDGLEFLMNAMAARPELSIDEALDLINEGADWALLRRATPEEAERYGQADQGSVRGSGGR